MRFCIAVNLGDAVVELSVGQEPGVARDARPMELELQPAIELEPQRPLLGFTHWIPSSEGVSGGLMLSQHKNSPRV